MSKFQPWLDEKNSSEIKKYILSLDAEKAMTAFQTLLVELYRGNGWETHIENGQIYLFESKTALTPFLIIETSVDKVRLSKEQTKERLVKFLSNDKTEGIVQQNFGIVSISGYASDAYFLEEYHLRLDNWEYVEELIDGYEKNQRNERKTIELLPHNKFAFRSVLSSWTKTNKVAVVQATGTGKSILAIQCLRQFKNQKKLILAPSVAILNQFKAIIPHPENVVLMTYHKAMHLKEPLLENEFAFIVLDEFHRIGAEKWADGVYKQLEVNPESHVLGLSATPIRYLDNARDMREELFENNVAVELSLEDAIAKRILPAPYYVSALYTLTEEIEMMIEKINKSRNKPNDKKKFTEELDIIRKSWHKSSGMPAIIRKHVTNESNKFIIFTESKEHLEEMKVQVTDWFEEAFQKHDVKNYEVWSEKGRIENELEIEKFSSPDEKGVVRLLFSINMLNEGLHVPGISGVVLLRKTISPIIYYQQIGRALEANKTNVPIVFDFVNNFKNISMNFFAAILKNAIDAERKKRENLALPFIVPEFFVHDETLDIKRLFKEIEDRLIYSWEEFYLLLTHYNEANGHCLVPHDLVVEDKNLGNWVGAQRQLYAGNKLSAEKVKKLNELAFVWDLNEQKWQDSFLLLVQFKNEFGHCFVPTDYISSGKNLESWLRDQRHSFKNNTLPQAKIDALNELGVVWDPFEETWLEMYTMLISYKEKHGHMSVPRAYKDNDKRLGAWIELQRYLNKSNRLSEERIRKLEEINFVWSPHEQKWEEMFSLFLKFVKEKGHGYVPADYEIEGKKLGNWVGDQRRKNKNMFLEPTKVTRLNQAGFYWNHLEIAWNEMYDLLIVFKKQYGHLTIPAGFEHDGKKLGNWASSQRQFFKNKKLSAEKIEKLKAVDFVLDPHQQIWNEMYECLVSFYKSEGKGTPIPYALVMDNKKVGAWASQQRRLYKTGKLAKERIVSLQSLGLFHDINIKH
jgi:superfamily II DNA or RNA helicase